MGNLFEKTNKCCNPYFTKQSETIQITYMDSSFIVNNHSQGRESYNNLNNNRNNNENNNNNINNQLDLINISNNNNINSNHLISNIAPNNTLNISSINSPKSNSDSKSYPYSNNTNNKDKIIYNINNSNNNNNSTIVINNIEIINKNTKEKNNIFTNYIINDLIINNHNNNMNNNINLNDESIINFSSQNSNGYDINFLKNNSLSSEFIKLDQIFFSSKNHEFIPKIERLNTIKSKKSKISLNSKNSKLFRNKSKSKFIKESMGSEDVELNLNSFNTYKSSSNINNTFISEISNSILNEINKARKNPMEYSKKIEKFISKISFDDSLKILFIAFKEFKYELKKGKQAFIECLNYLEFVDKNMKIVDYKLDPLIYLEELKFPFVLNDIDKLNEQNYIDECLEEMEISLNEKYQIKAFQYFKCIFDLDIFSVLHIVDENDNKKLIQKTIFNHMTKYIGINSIKLNENEGLYLILIVYAI
jgi:hypothetical protein